MDIINKIKEKIKQVSIDSKKYINDKNHEFHEAKGFLKLQIICGYIFIFLIVIISIYLIYLFTKYNFLNTIKILTKYSGGLGYLSIVFGLLYIGAYVFVIIFTVTFWNKLKDKDTTFLLYYHKFCLFALILYFVLMFFDFVNTIFQIFWFIIAVILMTLYYCLSIKVRVYFGGDAFLEKDYFIHFLLNNKYFNIEKEKNNIKSNAVDNVTERVSINNNIDNEKKVDNFELKDEKKDSSIPLKINEIQNTEKIEVRPKVITNYKYNKKEYLADKNVVKNHNQKKQKKKNIFISFLIFVIKILIKSLSIFILFLFLLYLNNKYQFSELDFVKNIFITVDEMSNNTMLFVKKIFSNINNNAEIDINNNEKNENNILATSDNEKEKSLSENDDYITRLSSDIRIFDDNNVDWQFDNQQKKWYLIVNNEILKDAICIINNIKNDNDIISATYGFDNEGKMITGWGVSNDGIYYYFDEDTDNIGVMVTGWHKIEDKLYFFESNGQLLINTITPDGYSVDDKGICVGKLHNITNDNIKHNGIETINTSSQINNAKCVRYYDEKDLIYDVDTVMYGRYYISNNYEKEPIEWVVLDKNGGEAILLSKYILDYRTFTNREIIDGNLSWENCDLREWLNNEFYNIAFNDNEKKSIIKSKVENLKDDTKYYTDDYVYLMNMNETKKYFPISYSNRGDYYDDNCARSTKGTKFANSIAPKDMISKQMTNGRKMWDYGNSWYFLRDVAGGEYGASVTPTGAYTEANWDWRDIEGIRPIIRVKYIK